MKAKHESIKKAKLRGMNFRPDGTPLSGDECMRVVMDEQGHNKILLSFSAGKDSIGAWIRLKDFGFEVTPYYLAKIPGLQFIEDNLKYYEDCLGAKIHRLIHRSFWRWLYEAVYLDPAGMQWALDNGGDALRLALMPFEDYATLVSDLVREEAALPPNTFKATGVRAADNMIRRQNIRQNGAINWTERLVMPVWDMQAEPLRQLLREKGVRLPEYYKWIGRSFDGLNYQFLKPIKEHYPDDYARILEFFPLAELELLRYEIG